MLTILRIERWDPRHEGPVTEAGLRQKVEACGYQVSTFAWPVGTIVPPQSRDCRRIDGVVSGILKITLDGEAAILTAGDVVHIPRGAVRRIEVVGSAPVHCVHAIDRQSH